MSLSKQYSLFGVMHIGPGRAWANIGFLFSVSVVFLAIFLLSANFSRREKAVGFLVADPQIIRINIPKAGRVQRIAVVEGQSVKKGDVLITIDPDPILVNGKPAAQAELDNITASEQEIQGRIQSISRQRDAKQRELSLRIAAVRDQIIAIRDGIELQKRTTDLVEDQLRVGTRLANSGALNTLELQRRETSLQDTKLNSQNLLYTLHQNEALLAELMGQQEQTPIEVDMKISDLKQAMVGLQQRRAEAEARMAFQVTAPLDGTIDTLLIALGQTVDASATVVSLLPESSVLQAELYVPSKAIVFVVPDKRVRIAYDAFPYARYGFAEGKVHSVSQTILRPDEIHKPVSPAEPSFRVTVTLDRQKMKSGEKDVLLRPGLTLTADIILDRQSLAQWILHSINELWTRV
jgi:membrane fusion protein